MLSKCVNPTCFASFRYLHEGKVFKLNRTDPRVKNPDNQVRGFEYFWLCGACANCLTVTLDQGVVTVRPLRLGLPMSTLEVESAKGKQVA